MDHLLAIGVGLSLRAVIDIVSNNNQRINGSLVGLWEGAVLHHFLYKFPSSIDPYVAYGFRLLVDFALTTSLTRLTIVVLWTGLGVLLSDVGLDLSEDSRFRYIRRRVRRILRSFLGVSTGRTPSRVQFVHIPASTTTASSNTTARSPPTQPTRSIPQARPRPPPTPAPVRAPSRHVPGSFTDMSETETEASRAPQNSTSSELEYLAMPPMPSPADSPDPLGDDSGLTTPLTETPDIMVHAPSRDHSGLTTPVGGSPEPARTRGLPPVTVIDEPEGHDHDGERTPTLDDADLPEIPAIPIPMRTSQIDTDGANEHPDDTGQELNVPPHLIDLAGPTTPGVVPPELEMPDIPDQVEREGAETEAKAAGDPSASNPSNPPPPYEQPIEDAGDKPQHDDTPPGSVISGTSRSEIVKKADSLRYEAQDKEKERDRLKMELQNAREHKEFWKAFRLKHEFDMVERNARQLHEKAARRYYKAHNLTPGPHEVDVRGLKFREAVEKVEEALYDTMISGALQLRVITGGGSQPQGKINRLKLAIIGAMQDNHIDAVADPTNPTVVLINLPSSPLAGGSAA